MSSSGIDPSEFIESGSGGPGVDWSGLGQLATGSLLVTAGLVYTKIYLAIVGALAGGIRWIGNAVAGLYGALGGFAEALVRAAFATASAFVSAFGVLSPVVGIALAVAVMFIWMRESQ